MTSTPSPRPLRAPASFLITEPKPKASPSNKSSNACSKPSKPQSRRPPCPSPITPLVSRRINYPKGIDSSRPGLRVSELPWDSVGKGWSTPTGLWLHVDWPTPSQLAAKRQQRRECNQSDEIFRRRHNALPLLGREGRGEGERSSIPLTSRDEGEPYSNLGLPLHHGL